MFAIVTVDIQGLTVIEMSTNATQVQICASVEYVSTPPAVSNATAATVATQAGIVKSLLQNSHV
uniref:Uncharacterized protein n=1 Tax=Arion vulgaris TaxID=1028688 RepID=A0A0B7BKZ8_9EUPU